MSLPEFVEVTADAWADKLNEYACYARENGDTMEHVTSAAPHKVLGIVDYSLRDGTKGRVYYLRSDVHDGTFTHGRKGT